MLRFLGLASALCLAVLPTVSIASTAPADRAHTLTVVVEAMLDARRAAIGTGVIIAQSGDIVTVATAAHIIAPGHVRVIDDRRDEMTVLSTRVIGNDLATITARIANRRQFEIAPLGRAERDGAVFLYGHPASGFWQIADATIIDAPPNVPDGSGIDGFMIQCTTCEHGNSGSGIFTSDGVLLGILTAAWRDSSGAIHAIEAVSIAPRLAQL